MFARKAFQFAVAALDLFPAPFRGQPGTIYAAWDFGSPVNPANADVVNTVPLPGAPLTQLYPSAELQNLGWLPAGADGGWYGLPGQLYTLPDGGIINITMPNYIDFEPIKQVWIQIRYLPGIESPYVAAIEALDNEVGQVYGVLNGYTDYTDSGFRVESWSIVPNPDVEQIQIFVPYSVFVDSVVIDTISVPEMSTLTMSAGGFLILGYMILRRRSPLVARS
jgi:hypothetical protein